MSREDIVKKTSPSDDFIHTAYVKFEGSTKEYAYLMSESQLQQYICGGCQVEVIVSGERKVVRLVTYNNNYINPYATKKIDCIRSKDKTLKTDQVKIGFFAGKYYQCIEQDSDALRVNKLTFGKYYQCFRVKDNSIGIYNDPGAKVFIYNSRFDPRGYDTLGSPPWEGIDNTRDDWVDCNKYAYEGVWVTDSKQNEVKLNINQQEEVKMSNRRVVNVQLIDDDKGLDVAFSNVYDFGNITTEDTNEVLIQELIMENDMADILLAHNAERMEQVNLELQDRTGQTVNLRPVKLKQLRWIIK